MPNQIQGISVIIPNFNGEQLLENNLPSLIESLDNTKNEYEIIVVDDASSDQSTSFLKNKYPKITIIQNKHNQGFSSTCNKGIRAAKMPLLCIVNTDVTFTPDYFNNALPAFSDPELFSIKGEIINYQNEPSQVTIVERTASLYYQHGFLRYNTRVKPDVNNLNGKINGQFTLLGCCFVCDREKMLSLNGFDEIFSPFYWEDSDLPLRALKRGYKLQYLEECKVYHKTSETISRYHKDAKRRLVSARNKFLFTWRHLNGFHHWYIHIIFTLTSLLVRWLAFDWRFYKAFFWAVRREISFNPKDY